MPSGSQPAGKKCCCRATCIASVKQLEYLGLKLAASGTIEAELSARRNKAAHKCRTLQPTFRLSTLGLRAKMRIFESSVMPTLLYGVRSWALTAQQEKKHVSHMRCLRRILGISLLDKIPDGKVQACCGQQPIGEQLRLQRLQWFGQVARMPDTRLPKQISIAEWRGHGMWGTSMPGLCG
ncbi:hypothetical protein N2152v2_007202 [Parachlorella kessleri]